MRDTFRLRDATRCPTVRKSTQEKLCLRHLQKAGRVGVDERWFGSEFQIFGATYENDLEFNCQGFE